MHEVEAMARAIELAQGSPDPRPNPRVGCVILSSQGELLAEGAHMGPGLPHAEAAAVAKLRGDVRGDVRGATAVVTLEPCNHYGRTGPCSDVLIESGISRVVYAVPDPNPQATGGAERLAASGVDVSRQSDVEAERLNETWFFAMRNQRPFVIWKAGATLDGRIAAADGSSRWITSEEARADAHQVRHEVDAIVVGTGTARQDDPKLTARGNNTRQPLRVVVGASEVPSAAAVRIADPPQAFRHLTDRDPLVNLKALFAEDVHSVLLEGGPTLAAAFLARGLVDRIHWYAAPKLLGRGPAALGEIGVESIDEAQRWEFESVRRVGPDVRLDLVPVSEMSVSEEEEDLGVHRSC